MEELKTENLFEDYKVKKPKKQTVQIKDIILVPGFENEEYMVDSIGGLGLLNEDIYLVRKGDRFTVQDGKRRIMASKANEETDVKAYVFDTIDDYKGALITLATNNARSNNPCAELEAIMICEKRNIHPATIRRLCNVSKSKISKLKSLLKLDKELLTALKKNRITFTMAYDISKMPAKEQKKLVKLYGENECITGDDIKAVQTRKKEDLAAELPDSLFEEFKPDKVKILLEQFNNLTAEEREAFLNAVKN